MRRSDIWLTRRQIGSGLAALACADLPLAAAGAPAAAAWLTLPPTPTLPTPTRSALAAINDTEIFFAQFGAGDPVLLLHGGLGNSNYFGHQIPALAEHHSVIAMDTRGHGRSPVTSATFGYRQFAADVVALLDHLRIAKVAVVGWSDGAVTGLELAMTRPDRLTRLFAFGGNTTPAGLEPNGARSPLFVAYAQRCRAEYLQLSPRPEKWPQLLAGLRAMWRSQPAYSRAELGHVAVPTAICDGEHDEIIRREHNAAMVRQISGARLVMLPRVSHFAMLQNPAQFTAAVLDFLDG
jgi:pimeloyl-ACP methyl ester carboxylesterase